MAYPLKTYQLDEIESSFDGFRTAVSYALLYYLYHHQSWKSQRHFRQIGYRPEYNPTLGCFKKADFQEPVKTLWFASPFSRVVYWHVQYMLRLGGYLNEND